MLNRHIIPDLGAVPPLKLAPQHLTTFYAEKRRNGKLNGSGGLSSRSVRILHNIIHEALDWAVRHQILARNVTDAIDAPKFSYKEKQVWTAEESRCLLAAAAEHEWGPLFLMLLSTGMRRGEYLGLRWRDLDWQAGKVRIAQQVTAVKGQIALGEPKTPKARRSVTLAPSMPCGAQRAPQRATRVAAQSSRVGGSRPHLLHIARQADPPAQRRPHPRSLMRGRRGAASERSPDPPHPHDATLPGWAEYQDNLRTARLC